MVETIQRNHVMWERKSKGVRIPVFESVKIFTGWLLTSPFTHNNTSKDVLLTPAAESTGKDIHKMVTINFH